MKYIFYISCIFTLGCDTNNASDVTKYIFINESDHHIVLTGYSTASGSGNKFIENYDLEIGDQIEFIVEPSDWTGPLANSPFRTADSIVTVFNDSLSIMYDRGRVEGNPMLIDNFTLLEEEENPYIYLFEFTNEDYERALERGRLLK